MEYYLFERKALVMNSESKGRIPGRIEIKIIISRLRKVAVAPILLCTAGDNMLKVKETEEVWRTSVVYQKIGQNN
jgi:hypothetical protein